MSANKSICKITSSVSQLLASQTLEHSWAFVLTVKSTTIPWLIANYDNRKGMYGITRTTVQTEPTKILLDSPVSVVLNKLTRYVH